MVERPDGTQSTLTLIETDDGVFEASHVTTVEGVYRFHLIGEGVTLRGRMFTRERLATGVVVVAGDLPARTSDPASGAGGNLCELLDCLLDHGTFDSILAEHKIDPDEVRRCIKRVCKHPGHLTEAELNEREGTAIHDHRAEPVILGDLSAAILERVTQLLDNRLPALSSHRDAKTTH